MKKIIINENQRGLLFENGRFVRMLEPGKHWTFGNREIEIVELAQRLQSQRCGLDVLLRDEILASEVVVAEIKEQELGLHYVDDKFMSVLMPGRYGFWNVQEKHRIEVVDTSVPEKAQELSQHVMARIPASLYTKVVVAAYEKGRLYYDKRFVKVLDAGTYYFWKGGVNVEAGVVDMRLTQMDVSGQEILTKDKVALRINLVCTYRILDAVKVLTEVEDFREQLHVAAQLAIRDFVGRYTIDEILESKEALSEYVLSRLQEKAKNLYVEITEAGVKDMILPGEIRDIMNTVLLAEKRAQANVITRREEVASTRSLLNTARMMEENQTLYKLKELEYLEKICENVGNITVSGSGDLLGQLATVLGRGR